MRRSLFLMVLSGVALVSLAAAATAGAEAAGDLAPLAGAARPTAERIELWLDPAAEDFRGRVRIDLALETPADTISLHAKGLKIEAVQLTQTSSPLTWSVVREEGDEGRIELAGPPLDAGLAQLTLDYRGAYNRHGKGLYKASLKGVPYLFTQFEPLDARLAFPCWDDPGVKIPYTVVVHGPADQVVVSNMPLAGDVVTASGRTWVFQPTPPTSSYLVALAVGPFDVTEIEGMGMPSRLYSPAGTAALTGVYAEANPRILEVLQTYFGRTFPYPKLDGIASFEFNFGGMENVGAIVYGAGAILIGPDDLTPERRMNLYSLVAHEMAHQWFGDLVTMAWWDDLWLNESFATWMARKVRDDLFPEDEVMLAALERIEGVRDLDAGPMARAVRKPIHNEADIFGDRHMTYTKGGAVLDMVESWVGEEAFRQGVQRYLERHAWGTARARDFYDALAAATGRPAVAAVLEDFIGQPGLPLIEAAIEGRELILRQRPLAFEGGDGLDRLWRVPVVMRFGLAGGEVERRTYLLREQEARLQLAAPPEWIVLNDGGRGYYRVRPEGELAERVAAAAAHLRPADQIDGLANGRALLWSGDLAGDAYLDLLARTAPADHPVVLTALTDALDDLVETFFSESGPPEAFRTVVDAWLGPHWRRLGPETGPDESLRQRQVRARLLGFLGHYGGLAGPVDRARDIARAYLDRGEVVDRDLIDAALEVYLGRAGTREDFERVLERLKAASTPTETFRALFALGSFGTPELQRRALDVALTDAVLPSQMWPIGTRISDDAEGAGVFLSWLEESYEALKAKVGEQAVRRLPGSLNHCSANLLEGAEAFFSRPEHRVVGTDLYLRRTKAAVQLCRGVRARAGATLGERLAALAAATGA